MADGPFVREAGAGPAVVCLHSNASSSAQWRSLMERLAPTHRVVAVDSYGAGRTAEWPSDMVITLADETALIEPVLAAADAPLVLVGHSYGAAIALVAALARPARIRALVLYEPPLCALVDAETPSPNDADGLRAAVAGAAAALAAGDPDAAAERFIDYWMGAGAWAGTPVPRRVPITAAVTKIRRWAHALFNEPTPLAAFARLDLPVLYLTGGRSPAAAHAVARLLTATLPRVERLEFGALGHMAPVTDPEPVNEAIAAWLARL